MTESAVLPALPGAASPGVWTLAWRRFCRDRLGLACLVVVVIYGAVMAACAAGWIVRDWSEEVAVTFAPPTFLGPEAPRGASSAAAAETAPRGALEDYGIPDPLADDLAEIAKELAGASATETRAATLAFGADKWGRDVLKKAVKGKEPTFDWAIGWLAREDQIVITREKYPFRIWLKQAQASAS